jgi:adenylate kinase family enzyme
VRQPVQTAPGAFPYRRVNVVGTTASGKTTFARALAERLGVPHVELDALHWEKDWTEAPNEVMRLRVERAIAGPEWVVDGNYSAVRDLVWDRAEAVVWLDFPLPTILWRYATRTRRRIRTQEELWPGTGNRESMWNQLQPRDGLLWWILGTYRRRRRDYPRLLAARPQLTAIRLCSAREAEQWLAAIEPT